MDIEPKYMRRALDLATRGWGNTSPNPMVGCVITAPNGTILGEGWHRKCGHGHAEVNAVAQAKERHGSEALQNATMYVALEPCSHWGRTPPCAKLIIDNKIPRVVVATPDPFSKVAGRGITMLREAGVEVEVGLMGEESRQLNAIFNTAHTLHRPFVTLKWAQSCDGFMDHRKHLEGGEAYRFSSPMGQLLVHRLREGHDAILIGSGTYLADHPQLNNRLWPGGSPKRIVLDRRGRITEEPEGWIVANEDNLEEVLNNLYSEHGITSVLVEGGSEVLKSFIDSNLWDAARVETTPVILGEAGIAPAPTSLPNSTLIAENEAGSIRWYSNSQLFTATHPMLDCGVKYT